MSRILLRLTIACAALGLTCSGCVTEERTRLGGHVLVRSVNVDDEGRDLKEGQLLDACEEHPESPKNWWRLGSYYEQLERFPQAIRAYEHVQSLTEEQEKKVGKKYVGALYLLGKCHTLARNYDLAVAYFRRVLELQPKGLQQAVLIPDFAESHYLLGAIYYEHRMYDQAEKHLIAFRELRPGDRRGDTMLIGIEDAVRPERRSHYVKSDDAPQRAAAQVDPSKTGTVTVEKRTPPGAPVDGAEAPGGGE